MVLSAWDLNDILRELQVYREHEDFTNQAVTQSELAFMIWTPDQEVALLVDLWACLWSLDGVFFLHIFSLETLI